MKSKILAFSFLAVFLLAMCLTGIKSASATSTTENTWTAKAPMPQAVGSEEVAVINGKIYVVGKDTNYEYNPATDTWATKKPMPTPRNYFGLAAVENKIYVIGGRDLTNVSSETEAPTCSINEVYNPETDNWETKAQMPTARTQIKAEAINGKIYVVAGRTGQEFTTVNLNEVYDPANDSWATMAPIPKPVTSFGCTVLDNKMYVIGGQNEYSTPMNAGWVQIYDPMTNGWTQGAHHPDPAWIGDVAAATVGLHAPKRIYVMGGVKNIAMPTNSNYVYDPELNAWNISASMPFPLTDFAIANVNDILYVIGGSNGWITLYSENQQYIPLGYGTIQPSTTSIAIISTVSIVVVAICIGVLYYLKKRRH